MSKWIAEFELEDGDTMPEHMDLEYNGVRIDFHCKPQEQEPIIDKIRVEIEQEYLSEGHLSDYWDGIAKCLQIIDKYKGEK